MALFFDAAWFEARLDAAGIPRDALAAALGLTAEQLDELWKDQREISERDVRVIAGLIGATPEDVATRAGVSTRAPAVGLEERLSRVERELEAIKALLAKRKTERA